MVSLKLDTSIFSCTADNSAALTCKVLPVSPIHLILTCHCEPSCLLATLHEPKQLWQLSCHAACTACMAELFTGSVPSGDRVATL